GIVVERGTYSEFLKSGIDIFSLFEKGNEQSELSPLPGTSTVISESLVQSLQSPRRSLKNAAPEDQEDHLEGKVGFKTYKNYFTGGADWSVIIFLILVHIAAQGIVVERGTYSEFLKSGIDIFSPFKKGNEQSEPSPAPGTPTVISESLVQSLQSPRLSLKDAAPEDQE
ncbi:hypothetical protein Celaphus_00016733, partial [Cervus elaphus hippelaphus]